MSKAEQFAPQTEDSTFSEAQVVPIGEARLRMDLRKEAGSRERELENLSKLFDQWTQEYGSDSMTDALQEYIDQLQVGLDNGEGGKLETAIELLILELKVVKQRIETDDLQANVIGISKAKQQMLRARGRLLKEMSATVGSIIKSVRDQIGGRVETDEEELNRLQTIRAENEASPLPRTRQAG